MFRVKTKIFQFFLFRLQSDIKHDQLGGLYDVIAGVIAGGATGLIRIGSFNRNSVS